MECRPVPARVAVAALAIVGVCYVLATLGPVHGPRSAAPNANAPVRALRTPPPTADVGEVTRGDEGPGDLVQPTLRAPPLRLQPLRPPAAAPRRPSTPAPTGTSTPNPRTAAQRQSLLVPEEATPDLAGLPAGLAAYLEQTKGNEAGAYARLSREQCALPADELEKAVTAQLKPWLASGITAASLDRYCVRNTLRVRVTGGRLRHTRWVLSPPSASRLQCALWLIQMSYWRAAARGQPMPDVDLVLMKSDGSQSTVPEALQWPEPGPLLANIKCRDDASISFPMSFHDQFGSFSGYMSLNLYYSKLDEFVAKLSATPWRAKQPTLFFSTGNRVGSRPSAKRGYRSELLRLRSPHLNISTGDFPLTVYAQHKFLVYAYGKCGWSRRIHELAFMNATLLMEDSACREYFHTFFQPGVHHEPVREDFADVPEKLAALAADPHRAEAMAAAWIARASAVFTPPCVLDYVEALLRRYAALQRFAPVEDETWPLYDPAQDTTIGFLFRSDPQPAASCPGLDPAHHNFGLTCN